MDSRRLPSAVLIFLACIGSAFAQSSFRLNDASRNVDIGIDVGKAPDRFALPSATYKFYRKGAKTPFQTVSVSRIEMWDVEPKANVTLLYDDQSVVNFGDFNFDGVEDVALNDGKGGGYGMPSYRVYLYSNRLRRFVLSRPVTRINQAGNLGFMEIDRKKRMLYRYTKSGCCWHQTEGFSVMNGLPRKVYELTEEVLISNPKVVQVTTYKLVRGKWRKWVKHAKTAEYYKE